MKRRMQQRFSEVFGQSLLPPRVFFCGGRVNLIGEHTDYNGGFVFPCALTMGTYGAVRLRQDRRIRLFSDNFAEAGVIEADLDELRYDAGKTWGNYPLGVLWALRQRGLSLFCGFELLLYGDLPNGAGLSSSASVEVLTGFIVDRLYGFNVDQLALAILGQKAENAFIGVNCGIMDQFACAMGRPNTAMLLDTATLACRYAKLPLDNVDLLILDTKKQRGLAGSKYNERRSECETALSYIRRVCEAESLGALTEAAFAAAEADIPEPYRSRARHAVTENLRTVKAADALDRGDLYTFGQLMNASHASLRDDYQVSCRELDQLVFTLQGQPGVLGARMTGAGFGGCAVALAESRRTDEIIERTLAAYRREIGCDGACYRAGVGGGPREI